MASNINIAAARIATAAISHTQANGKRFANYGTVQALRSPQVAALIAEMNPINAKNQNRLSIQQGQATPLARVTLNYRPQQSVTVDTSRTVATGANPTAATALNVDYNLHRELKLTYRTVDLMALEAEAERYLESINRGQISASIPGMTLLSDMGDQIMGRIENVFTSVDSACLSALVAAAGGNLMIGTASPANLAVPNVNAFRSTDGSVHLDFYDWLKNLQVVHQFSGRPIVIGGLRPMMWFNRKGIVSAASLGYDYAKAFNDLDVEFYYDPLVDTLSGTDHVIVLDPGAACLESIMEHSSIITMPRVANTTYGTVSVNVAQTAAPTFSMDMDIRVREDDTAYPNWTIIPSIRFGVFTRPAGFHKNYGGFDTVTGIFRAKLVTV